MACIERLALSAKAGAKTTFLKGKRKNATIQPAVFVSWEGRGIFTPRWVRIIEDDLTGDNSTNPILSKSDRILIPRDT